MICLALLAYDVPRVIDDLRRGDELWSPEADQIACAIEALTPGTFPSNLDFALLMLWVQDTVSSEARYLTPDARANLLAFRSDSLAFAVCESGDLEQIPQLGDLLLQHRPGVVYQLGMNGVRLPVSVAAHLVHEYRQRFANETDSIDTRQEVAKTLAMLLRQLVGGIVTGQELPTEGNPLGGGELLSTAEVDWLGQLLRESRACSGYHAAYRGSALYILLWVLLEEHEWLVAPAAHHALFVAGYEWIAARQRSLSPLLASRVFRLLASPDVPIESAVRSVMGLSSWELDLAIEYLVGRPELFTPTELRRRVAASKAPVARLALAVSAIELTDLGQHLRWLVINAPDLAYSAIEARVDDVVHVLERNELRPLLASSTPAVRAGACSLLHRWPACERTSCIVRSC